jgi:ribosomal protein S18 acetylase RimI-like enzyme
MEIRKATPVDADGIAIVLKESYNIDSVDEGKEVFSSERGKGVKYLVATTEDGVVGLTTWYTHGLPKHGLCELDRIAVLPDHRGKGIAKELFDGLVADAKEFYESKKSKLRKLILLTHASNSRAHAFYEKMGMKKEAVLPTHYYDNEDEWVYSRYF